MSEHQQVKTRLSDLLIERGLITQDQLLEAVKEQKTVSCSSVKYWSKKAGYLSDVFERRYAFKINSET